MPVMKVKGGYRWGKKGKVYKTKAEAERQGRAAYASGYGKKKKAKACQITAARAKSRSIGAGIDQVSSYAMSKHSAFGASNGAFSDHL